MRHAIAAALVLIAAPSSFAAADALDAVLGAMERRQDAIRVVRFDFAQTIDFLDNDMASRVEGKALLGRPDKLSLTRKNPVEQTTISDGERVWVYTPSYNQVWVGDRKDWESGGGKGLPPGLLRLDTYVTELKKNYDLTLAKEGDEVANLTAKPKNNPGDHRIDLVVSRETWLPREIVYTSASAVVKTAITNVDVNPNVKDSAFQFETPEGADVIPMN